jgi:hypothetical protein
MMLLLRKVARFQGVQDTRKAAKINTPHSVCGE